MAGASASAINGASFNSTSPATVMATPSVAQTCVDGSSQSILASPQQGPAPTSLAEQEIAEDLIVCSDEGAQKLHEAAKLRQHGEQEPATLPMAVTRGCKSSPFDGFSASHVRGHVGDSSSRISRLIIQQQQQQEQDQQEEQHGQQEGATCTLEPLLEDDADGMTQRPGKLLVPVPDDIPEIYSPKSRRTAACRSRAAASKLSSVEAPLLAAAPNQHKPPSRCASQPAIVPSCARRSATLTPSMRSPIARATELSPSPMCPIGRPMLNRSPCPSPGTGPRQAFEPLASFLLPSPSSLRPALPLRNPRVASPSPSLGYESEGQAEGESNDDVSSHAAAAYECRSVSAVGYLAGVLQHQPQATAGDVRLPSLTGMGLGRSPRTSVTSPSSPDPARAPGHAAAVPYRDAGSSGARPPPLQLRRAISTLQERNLSPLHVSLDLIKAGDGRPASCYCVMEEVDDMDAAAVQAVAPASGRCSPMASPFSPGSRVAQLVAGSSCWANGSSDVRRAVSSSCSPLPLAAAADVAAAVARQHSAAIETLAVLAEPTPPPAPQPPAVGQRSTRPAPACMADQSRGMRFFQKVMRMPEVFQ